MQQCFDLTTLPSDHPNYYLFIHLTCVMINFAIIVSARF